jgi:hypothetical protein
MNNPTLSTTKDEMTFRLSLLRLMTLPHEGSGSVTPGFASSQIEELSILARRPDASQPGA